MEPELDRGKSAAHQLATLAALQALDRERDGKTGLVESLPRVLGARRRAVEAAAAAVTAAAEKVTRAKATARERELELKSRTAEIGRLELQLNTAKTNQEYQALQHHIQRLREESARIEEDTLVLYDEIEALESGVARQRETQKKAEAEYAEFEAACGRDRAEAESEVAATDSRRADLVARLRPDLYDTYEKLRKARDGEAVSEAQGRICTGCGINLTPNDHARLVGLNEIVTCRSCSRILYDAGALSAVPKP